MEAVHRQRCPSLLDSVSRMPIVNIEVETDEEDHGDQEADEGQEDELLKQARFLEVHCELVLLFRQLVAITFQ